MLTDIFANRYANVLMWEEFDEQPRRLLVQLFRIVKEQVLPFYTAEGKERAEAVAMWTSLHDRLSMELGLQELSPRGYWAQYQLAGNNNQYWQTFSMLHICQSFVCADYTAAVSADRFIKERISFIELAFRDRENQVSAANASLDERIAMAEAAQLSPTRRRGIVIPGNRADGVRAFNAQINEAFRTQVRELNERLRQVGTRLHYHNGFLQIADDVRVVEQIEEPFWNLLAPAKWRNVDTDMKEAIDLRDTGGRDPAFHAAKALESTIKIISNERGLTTGSERGASSFIDNLVSERSNRFIASWEQEALKAFFSKVRNELGHGAGAEPMPELSFQQTNWAIEFCMSWIKSLIQRNLA